MTAEATLLESLPPEERLILPCLQHIQRGLGYISDSAVNVVAEFLNVSRAEVIGVLTYYHDLRRTPPPAVVVGVCVAEACQAAGVRSLIEHIEHDFGVTLGAGTGSGPVEFAKAYCLGNCALGPAVMVNGRLVGRCDIARVRAAVVNAQVVPR
ncbi:MAG: NAD(P)H-dependent oxidoreductase subunit E [Mycobacterium sp.]